MLAGPQLVLSHVHADGGVTAELLAQQAEQTAGEDAAGSGGEVPLQLFCALPAQRLAPFFAGDGDLPLHQLVEDHLHVAHQRHGGTHILADLRRVHVNVDGGHPLFDLVGGDDGTVGSTGADHDQQVGLGQRLVGAGVAVGADHTHVQFIPGFQQGKAHHGGHHGDAGPAGKGGQFLLRTCQKYAAAGTDHRAAGPGNGVGHVGDLLVVAPDAGVIAPDHHVFREGHVLHHLLLHVAGDVDEHRAGAAGGGDVKGLFDDAGQLGGVLDQIRVLGKGRHCAGDVHLLKDVTAQQVTGHLTGDGHHGDGIHVGGGDAGDEVGGAGAGGHHAHAHLTGDTGVAGSHVAGVLLGTHQRVADLRRGTQHVHHRTDGGTGVTKDVVHLLPQEAFYQNLCACHVHGSAPFPTN